MVGKVEYVMTPPAAMRIGANTELNIVMALPQHICLRYTVPLVTDA